MSLEGPLSRWVCERRFAYHVFFVHSIQRGRTACKMCQWAHSDMLDLPFALRPAHLTIWSMESHKVEVYPDGTERLSYTVSLTTLQRYMRRIEKSLKA